MISDNGAWYCDGCQRRTPDGGVSFWLRGRFDFKRLKAGDGTIYCSEVCLRRSLHGISGDHELEKAYSKIASLERAIGRQKSEFESRRSVQTGLESQLEQVATVLEEIKSLELTRQVADTPQGKLLRQKLEVLRRQTQSYAGGRYDGLRVPGTILE